jgi:TRAP-type mannitol/chloroaromatic compound transport system permease small subunit
MTEPTEPTLQEHGLSPAEYTEHPGLPRTGISDTLDRIVLGLSHTLSWFWLAIVGVILYAVIGRYAFGAGSVMLEEVTWHLSGAIWLMGLSSTLVTDHHVRVDVLHERLSLRAQAWIELLGLTLLLLPFLVIAMDLAFPYFWSSFTQGERSSAPAGLPARWVLKFAMFAAFVMLTLAAVSRLLKCTALLFGRPVAVPSKASGSR